MLTEKHLSNLQAGDKLNSPEGFSYEIIQILHEAFQVKYLDAIQPQQHNMQLLSWTVIKQTEWSIAE